MKHLYKFKGSSDYRFNKILENDKFIVYEQLDKDDLTRIVAWEVHQKRGDISQWIKTCMTLERAEIVSNSKIAVI